MEHTVQINVKNKVREIKAIYNYVNNHPVYKIVFVLQHVIWSKHCLRQHNYTCRYIHSYIHMCVYMRMTIFIIFCDVSNF